MTTNDPRGSFWRRWDLHVHTPASLYHRYGGDGDDVWAKFIDALEALPSEFEVIGINDYLFLDGYRRVLEYKSQGRLQNIQTFFPVLEFRVDKFAGTERRLRRINCHVIFSNEVTTEQIEQQFLNRLSAHYKLTPGLEHDWGGVITRESLRDLGAKIIASVPPDKKVDYGPPLVEGFNNLNLSLADIQSALDSPYFRDKFVTAVGKAEWSALKWNEQSIAEKKTIINNSHLVFTAAENPAAYHAARAALQTQGVNDRLFDCSDAHNWADSGDKDSLGRCDLWVKADPTFRGLQHAILEFADRVYVGSEPPQVARVRSKPQNYVSSLTIERVPGAQLTEHWFDCEIRFNPGLVAIIGNKGAGKSALADITALGGNSRQEANFSFLNPDKFRNLREDKSIHFVARLVWESGEQREYKLSEHAESEEIERVRYIPQSHLEHLCNELAAQSESAFDLELRAVIFSHIPSAARLGKPNLDALIGYISEETHDRINALRGSLSKLNREIAALEKAAAPEHRRETEKKRAARLKELAALEKRKPRIVAPPDADAAAREAASDLQTVIERQRDLIEELQAEMEAIQQSQKSLVGRITTADKLLQRVRNLEETHREVRSESEGDLELLGFAWTDIVRFETDTFDLKQTHADAVTQLGAEKARLDRENEDSEVARLDAAKQAIKELQAQLDAPTRRYQEYLTANKSWKQSVAELKDDEENPDSIASLDAEIKRISELPQRIAGLDVERMAICKQIYAQLDELKERYRELYRPVQDFIEGHKTLAESIQLSFDVRIDEMNVADEISDWINKGKSGSFQGGEEGSARIKEIVRRHSFDASAGLEAFLEEFMQTLKNDVRQDKPRPVSTSSQLKRNRTTEGFYDFLYGLDYLRPRYALQMDGKEIHELSPGERGLLLLLFYLLVEKGDGPLILDQPEENLDNETVHQVLVPSIRLAKQRRQVVVVTHNPNLAVVADADQIIVASIDKKNRCAVTYESGALENPRVNTFVVTYLEGTLPAFMNRDRKYIR